MKLFTATLASSVLAVCMMGGCAMNPHNQSTAAPALKVMTADHNIAAGTSTRVTAETMNVVGGSDIKWSVTPDVAHIRVDGRHGTSALFSSDQQGTYTVKAAVDLGNGNWVSNTVDITVNGVNANGTPVNDNGK